MTTEEFNAIRKTITAEYGFKSFLASDEQNALWFNTFIAKGLTYADVKNGAIEYMRNNSECPHLGDIVAYSIPYKNIRRAAEEEEERKKANPFSNTVKCPKCKDAGILYEWKEDRKDENGNRILNYFTREQYREKYKHPEMKHVYEYVYPCSCEAGRKRWPKEWNEFYGGRGSERYD